MMSERSVILLFISAQKKRAANSPNLPQKSQMTNNYTTQSGINGAFEQDKELNFLSGKTFNEKEDSNS